MAASADQILTVLLSGLIGYGGKWAQDWWTAKKAQKKEDEALWSLHKQQFHLPLLDAGRQLEARLSEPARRRSRSAAAEAQCYELTLATSSLHWTARYLASARLVHLHLSGGGSSLDTPDREGLDQLIADLGPGSRDRAEQESSLSSRSRSRR